MEEEIVIHKAILKKKQRIVKINGDDGDDGDDSNADVHLYLYNSLRFMYIIPELCMQISLLRLTWSDVIIMC